MYNIIILINFINEKKFIFKYKLFIKLRNIKNIYKYI